MSFLEILQNCLSRLGYGGITAVIGILIVFVGLAIIILSLVIMAKVFQALEKHKAEKAGKAAEAEAAAAAASAENEPAAVQEAQPETETVEDSELIAVIAAAIAAFDFGGKPVAIKSVRRVNGWKNAARNEQVFKF